MLVQDLVSSAAFNNGLVSSPDETPSDVVDMGYRVLVDLLPAINCDRMLDITQTARVYTPTGNQLILKTFEPRRNFEILGYSRYNADDLRLTHWREELARFRPGIIEAWPTDDFGTRITVALWSRDNRLIYGQSEHIAAEMPDVNIDFMPYRIDSIIDERSRGQLSYKTRVDFESIYFHDSGVFTTEEYCDGMIVLFHGVSTPVRLIIPFPLQIINGADQKTSEIIAPVKFKTFLIDLLAWRLASIYGLGTKDEMHANASTSYNLLCKNRPNHTHDLELNVQMYNTLRAPAGHKLITR